MLPFQLGITCSGAMLQCAHCILSLRQLTPAFVSERLTCVGSLDLNGHLFGACAEVAFFTFIDTMLPGQVCEMAGACFPQLVKNHPLPALSAPLAHSLGNILNAPKLAGADNNMCDTCKVGLQAAPVGHSSC